MSYLPHTMLRISSWKKETSNHIWNIRYYLTIMEFCYTRSWKMIRHVLQKVCICTTTVHCFVVLTGFWPDLVFSQRVCAISNYQSYVLLGWWMTVRKFKSYHQSSCVFFFFQMPPGSMAGCQLHWKNQLLCLCSKTISALNFRSLSFLKSSFLRRYSQHLIYFPLEMDHTQNHYLKPSAL